MKKKKSGLMIAALVCFVMAMNGQITGSRTYDFRDGTIITAGKSTDGSLMLSGTYKLHGATYGLNMKVGGKIKIAVPGSTNLRFLGSAYSSLYIEGKTKGGVALEPKAKATKVSKDLAETFDFVYTGSADTLTFTTVSPGSDLYLPTIDVVPAQAGATVADVVKNTIYYFDLRDGSIIPNQTSLNGNYTIEKGLFKIECGPSNGYGYNGNTHGSILKTGNKITLKVGGNSYIRIGGCQYSNGTITVSSTTGSFDKSSQASKTTTCFHQDGATVNFLYAGSAGTVILDFTGTTYIPYIEIKPVPYSVELVSWVKKTGSVTINGTVINFTAGDNSTTNPAVTVSAGTFISATPELASIRINLGGKALSAHTPALSGDIASVAVTGDTLKLTLTNPSTNPGNYKIVVADNSIVNKAEPGKTYNYPFNDGSVLPQVSYASLRYNAFVTKDGLLSLMSNTDTHSKKFGYHDAQHGAVFFPGNSMKITVAGNATVTFGTCQYGSATDAVFEFSDAGGTVLGAVTAHNIGKGVCGSSTFNYKGSEGIITATLKSASFPTAEVYIHGVTVENAARIESTKGKTDVWDFGAEQFDTTLFNNKLSVSVINSWYAPAITPGSSNNVLPGFTSGILSWVGGSNDRLRTTNTSITRYDQNIASAVGYTGRIYVNAAAATGRYLSLTLGEDNEVTVVARTDAGGNINFQYVGDPAAQTDIVPVSNLDTLSFVAQYTGIYHIFDNVGKPSYFRIFRKEADYVTITGTVDVNNAPGIPNGYGIILKNNAGKTWNSVVSNKTFIVQIPAGCSYTLSLSGANGFMMTGGTTLDVTKTTTKHAVTVKRVELYTVSGSISGLDPKIANLSLVYTPDPAAKKIYQPEPVINVNAKTYSVQLEPNCRYKITAKGVNDYSLTRDTLTIGKANVTTDMEFIAKPLFRIFPHATDLTSTQWQKLGLTFTNLNESGYSYTFSPPDNILLRNGVYAVSYSGMDEYPVEMALTSNVKVESAVVQKYLTFNPVTLWSFDDKVIPNGTTAYKGLLFSGSVSNEQAKGHLVAKPGATVKIPVKPGDKVKVTYYYSADFSFDGGTAITTSSGSTSQLEYAQYSYKGTQAGFVTITVGSGAGTTYFPEVEVIQVVPYKAVIYVGPDKEYKTINDALAAVGRMERSGNERVTVMIDPGNYEEMLVITTPNITLKNAAVNPGIALTNKGAGIAAGAVRITSYYGHGYSYYSMGNNQKWNGDLLKVNKENGYLSYENKGAGTTNGSYWNATVVINANGFTAEDIIFENSFNQYISRKEAEDVVVMWSSGGKGIRPTDYGNTKVQQRSFVERAAAIAIMNNADKVVLKKCRVIGRQDTFYGGTGTRVVVYRGSVMGAVDYIFGGMTAVFYKTDLAMNTSDDSGDAAYLTAAQQSSGRGYLMFECNVVSANPGTETASTMHAKPGYFGRPWQATTSEVVFYKTSVDVSDYTGNAGQSLISPAGWQNTLGGESKLMYEFGTIEKSGVDNSKNRASWSTVLTTPTLSDGTAINTFNFTKGSDGWDPLTGLIAGDPTVGITVPWAPSSVNVYSAGSSIYISNVRSETRVDVYNTNGMLMKSLVTENNTGFNFMSGLWVVKVSSPDGQKAVKVFIQ